VNQEQILAAVREIIGDVLDQPDVEIDAATTAADVEGWDSFNHINIVIAVERHFAIKFNTAEVEEMHNVGELVALVQQKMK
jgi:acyl carrier protein